MKKCKWEERKCTNVCLGFMMVEKPEISQLLCDRPIIKPIVLIEEKIPVLELYKKWMKNHE